jgi:hypothetical protein
MCNTNHNDYENIRIQGTGNKNVLHKHVPAILHYHSGPPFSRNVLPYYITIRKCFNSNSYVTVYRQKGYQ